MDKLTFWVILFVVGITEILIFAIIPPLLESHSIILFLALGLLVVFSASILYMIYKDLGD